MNHYLNEVWKNLEAIPKDEAVELMEYYDEYFHDSGLTIEEIKSKYGPARKFARVLTMNYLLEQESLPQDYTNKHRRFQLVWFVILGLFSAPILLPLALSGALLLISLCIIILAVLICCYTIIASLIIAGVVTFFAGCAVMMQSFSTALFYGGLGLVAIGLGSLLTPAVVNFTYLLVHLLLKFVKWIARKLTSQTNLKGRGEL